MRVSLICCVLLALPAVALAGTWTQTFSQSVIMGISMADENTGYIAGGNNGVGANVLKTTDGAQTFTSVPIAATMMLLAINTGSATQAVTSGIGILAGGDQYTSDGTQFQASAMSGVSMQEAQDVQTVCKGSGGWTVATTGQWNFFDGTTINGIAISDDGGQTFSFSNTTLDPNLNPTRYSSYPTCNTGYISAGSWPPNSKTGVLGVKQLSRNIHLHYDETTRLQTMHFTELGKKKPNTTGWSAAIAYSGDNDDDWKQVFSASNFYFNQIACPTASVCYAAAENDDDGFIYGTKDGGKTWQELHVASGTSLMAAQAISENEFFIGGGVLGELGINGTVFHSADGGKTFDVESVPGYYFMSLSMLSAEKGFATALDAMSQSDVLVYA